MHFLVLCTGGDTKGRHSKSQSDDLEGVDRAVFSEEDATKSPYKSSDEEDD